MRLYGGNQSDKEAYEVKLAWETLTGERLDREMYSYVYGVSDNHVKAMIVYCDYTGYSITVHMYAPRVLNRKLVQVGLMYPFQDLKVTKLYSEFSIKKDQTRRCLEGAGFRYEALIEDFYGEGEDKVIMVATEKDITRWIK